MDVEVEKIGLKKENAPNRAKWKDGMQAIAEGMEGIRPTLISGQHQIKTE